MVWPNGINANYGSSEMDDAVLYDTTLEVSNLLRRKSEGLLMNLTDAQVARIERRILELKQELLGLLAGELMPVPEEARWQEFTEDELFAEFDLTEPEKALFKEFVVGDDTDLMVLQCGQFLRRVRPSKGFAVTSCTINDETLVWGVIL